MANISIDKAAKLCGKSEATLRRWAAVKIVPATKTPDGRWLFSQEELSAHMSANGEALIESGKMKPLRKTAHVSPSTDPYAKQIISTLEEALNRERMLGDEVRVQLQTANAEVLRLTLEIKSILSKDTKLSPTRWIRTKVQEAFGG